MGAITRLSCAPSSSPSIYTPIKQDIAHFITPAVSVHATYFTTTLTHAQARTHRTYYIQLVDSDNTYAQVSEWFQHHSLFPQQIKPHVDRSHSFIYSPRLSFPPHTPWNRSTSLHRCTLKPQTSTYTTKTPARTDTGQSTRTRPRSSALDGVDM